jgi:hypothetical protein
LIHTKQSLASVNFSSVHRSELSPRTPPPEPFPGSATRRPATSMESFELPTILQRGVLHLRHTPLNFFLKIFALKAPIRTEARQFGVLCAAQFLPLPKPPAPLILHRRKQPKHSGERISGEGQSVSWAGQWGSQARKGRSPSEE